jgi:hypothetical protein
MGVPYLFSLDNFFKPLSFKKGAEKIKLEGDLRVVLVQA